MSNPTPYESLQLVRQSFETEEAMASALGVTQPTVWRWLNQAKRLPAEKVLLAERLTTVARFLLRPDIYPPEEYQSPGGRPVETPAAADGGAAGVGRDALQGSRS
jgi:transposase-like protein